MKELSRESKHELLALAKPARTILSIGYLDLQGNSITFVLGWPVFAFKLIFPTKNFIYDLFCPT